MELYCRIFFFVDQKNASNFFIEYNGGSPNSEAAPHRRMRRRAKTALAREKRSGLTLEFSPHDSTLLQIEGVGNKITRITKMVIVIEEKISETKDYALHKGTRDSSPVCVYVVKLGEATFEAAKRAVVARDQASKAIFIVYSGN